MIGRACRGPAPDDEPVGVGLDVQEALEERRGVPLQQRVVAAAEQTSGREEPEEVAANIWSTLRDRFFTANAGSAATPA